MTPEQISAIQFAIDDLYYAWVEKNFSAVCDSIVHLYLGFKEYLSDYKHIALEAYNYLKESDALGEAGLEHVKPEDFQ